MIRHSFLKSEVQQIVERYHQERLLRLMRHKTFTIVLECFRTGGVFKEKNNPEKWSLFGKLCLPNESWIKATDQGNQQDENDISLKNLRYWTDNFPGLVPKCEPIDLIIETHKTEFMEFNSTYFSFVCYLASTLNHPLLDRICIFNPSQDFRLQITRFKNGNISCLTKNLAPLELVNIPKFIDLADIENRKYKSPNAIF